MPGNGRVTLYWDSEAEQSFDQFLAGLGRDPNDFEGYRVYRSTDAAFLDPLVITDGFGNQILRKPIAQFDLIDQHAGFHPVDINGIKFDLGTNRVDPGEDDNGLTHVFVDSTVTNGIRYFYAVTAYDYGSAVDNIPPTETPIRIQRLADGTIRTGPNVVEVTATPRVAGYTDARISQLERVRGATSSRIGWDVYDPRSVRDGHQYSVIFEDTLIAGRRNAPDTLTTKNFSLIDRTENDTLLLRSESFRPGREFPIFDRYGDPLGFRLIFFPEPFIVLNTVDTGWNQNEDEIYPISLQPYNASGFVRGLRNPADYRVKVVGDAEGQSVELQIARNLTLPARPTNVQVLRLQPDGTEVPVDYAFGDLTGPDFVSPLSTEPARWSADPDVGESDLIILNERQVGDEDGPKVITWSIGLNFVFDERRSPEQGETVDIITRKPFLSTDEFSFRTEAPTVNEEEARNLLDNVTVVPNPYVATNSFETLNPFATGRGPRTIKFTNLPPEATLRIFTVSGRLLRELRRNEGDNDPRAPEALLDGTLDWDLQSEDNLTVSYGIYLYHVEAPGIGETTGTFAIIK